MDERRARIHDDLRGALEGELRFEPLERAGYALDASLYEIDPLGVIVPRTELDVVTTVRYAAENGIPIHARGAGTGLAGGAIGPGLVIDFSKYLRRVVEIQPDRVVVQPGVVLDVLNAQLAPLGRRIGPDPVGSEVATVGGMVGLDAAGPCSLRYGTTGDHVERMRVVFAGGETAELGRELWPVFDDEPTDFKGTVVRKLGALVRRNMDLLVRKAPRSPRNRAGYALARAATGVGIHLARLLVGAEGTLALVTEVSLRTVPIPAARTAVLLPFARIVDAAGAATECLDASPTACDLYDWRTIHLAREVSPQFREWIAESAESVVVLLFEGDDPEEVSSRAARLTERIGRVGRLVADPVLTSRRPDCDRLLAIRKAVEPHMMRMKGRARPVSFVDDVAVPPQHLQEMLQRLQNIMRAHEVSWTFDANAGHGQLHPRPFLDLTDPRDLAKIEALAVDVHEAALDLGGTVSGENGCGLVRTQFLRRQFGDLLPVFREVKDAFDPLNLLNPGKVIGDDPHLMLRDLRRYSPSSSHAETPAAPPVEIPEPVLVPLLRWADRGVAETASACNGCGVCRSREPGLRMCPTFRAQRAEESTPRAKANLIRQLMTGMIDPRLWGSEEFQRNADLCTHCNLCRKECPSDVDVSSLMLEAKAAYVENHGLAPGDWALSRVEMWSRIASRLPILSNALLASGPARWVLERLLGLSRLRRLPRAHRTPFTRRAARLGLTRARPHEPGPRVVYFVDVYANYFDQDLAESVVAILRQAGVNVFIPSRQRGSGMPSLVVGDVDHARELALANLRVLGNAVRDGYTIVCSEPTAALMLRQEYFKLTDDLDATLVAENTREIGQYLTGLEARGQLGAPHIPFRAKVGYHQPCHLRGLDVGTPGLDLIRKIPEIDVEFIDRGCSGMAGTYGLHRDHFRNSLRAGNGLLSRLRDPDIELGSTECSACRVQMEQSAPKRTLHPIKLLSLGYGLSPSLRRKLKEPRKIKHEVW
ncbi:MAG: FAD-binding and (Fe-S)-binding domain-containing protein [Isosphaeraceae bacterium]